ncbi:MAG: EamA family transporter [Advenella sp.]|uniref:EamA family transporter n=1 Tax=Advenella sp. TaxID=1872388 RepID=UPI003F9C75FE
MSSLLFLSPLTAVLLGWLFLDQTLTLLQIAGLVFIIGSIWLSQRANRQPSNKAISLEPESSGRT